MDLALLLRTTPDAVEEMKMGDSVMLLTTHYEREERNFRLEAALHGMEVK